MDLWIVQIIGAGLLGLAFGLEVWRSRRSEKTIRDWARNSEYHLLMLRNVFPFAGPFFWTKSGQQTVFRVTIRDNAGAAKSAWLLCGHWWRGVLSDEIVVRWDEGVNRQK